MALARSQSSCKACFLELARSAGMTASGVIKSDKGMLIYPCDATRMAKNVPNSKMWREGVHQSG
jgi:hypothetical protein